MKTGRLYWEDDHCFDADAVVIGLVGEEVLLDRTIFYPGGGGQPADAGVIRAGENAWEVLGLRADEEGGIWHRLAGPEMPAVGQPVQLAVARERRSRLTHYHTVLHILNTTVLQHYNGWITGAQIGEEYSRIDFKLEALTPEMCRQIEAKVNAVIAAGLPLRSFFLPEAEFAARPDLLRTLEVKPPVIEGKVRVVSIEGFDAQACGGTHSHTTAELGRFSITKTENKGKINKRMYVRLEPAAS